jgi:hypothetical protein
MFGPWLGEVNRVDALDNGWKNWRNKGLCAVEATGQ